MTGVRDAADFWSRRKARVAREEEAERAEEAAEEARRARARLEEKADEEILAELELKDPDTLEEGDDFAAFLRSEVPERLRKRALRRLWRSNPVLANLDGLVDYADDYTDSACAVENLQTGYQVGKGMLSHILAEAEKAEKAEKAREGGRATLGQSAEAEDAAEVGAAAPETPVEPPVELAEGAAPQAALAHPGAEPDVSGEGGGMPQHLPSRRRMKISYTEVHDTREGA